MSHKNKTFVSWYLLASASEVVAMKNFQAALCLSGVVLIAARNLTEVDNVLSTLETLVQQQAAKLSQQETELAALRSANAATDSALPPSIFGSGRPDHRAYTFEAGLFLTSLRS